MNLHNNVGEKLKNPFVLKNALNFPTHPTDIIASTEIVFVGKWKETGLLMTQSSFPLEKLILNLVAIYE